MLNLLLFGSSTHNIEIVVVRFFFFISRRNLKPKMRLHSGKMKYETKMNRISIIQHTCYHQNEITWCWGLLYGKNWLNAKYFFKNKPSENCGVQQAAKTTTKIDNFFFRQFDIRDLIPVVVWEMFQFFFFHLLIFLIFLFWFV